MTADLRRIDDGSKMINSIHAKVGDRKCATLELLRLQLVCSCLLRQISDLLGYLWNQSTDLTDAHK